MIGKVVNIAGMVIEIVADEGDKWRCLNTTTKESILLDKAVVDRAIRLGQADVVADDEGC